MSPRAVFTIWNWDPSAPGISLPAKVHWKVGAGVPEAATVKVAGSPSVVVRETGCTEIVGATETGAAIVNVAVVVKLSPDVFAFCQPVIRVANVPVLVGMPLNTPCLLITNPGTNEDAVTLYDCAAPC